MLIPRRVKHRKQHHPSRKGATKGGSQVAFGDFGIQALAPAYVTKSPNATCDPPFVAPLRDGWCCLRCLTRRGINIS